MELACPGFLAVNVPRDFEQPEDLHEYFSLQAPPNTSIWRKPSASDDTTAPMVLKCLHQSFILAEVTVSADFSMEFDQAGIVIFAGSDTLPDLASSPRSAVGGIRSLRSSRLSRQLEVGGGGGGGGETRATGKWAKAGLEFIGGELHAASVVAISSCGADWSSSARMPASPATMFDPYSLMSHSLRVKLERVDESLWIWYKIPQLDSQQTEYDPRQHQSPEDVGSGWKKMREIMGFFSGGLYQKGNVWVGCYASRPMDFEPMNSWEEVDGLVAEFEDLDIL